MLPVVTDPVVTIVIVTFGQWPLCRRALDAIVEHTEPVYQVVVIDNASPDDTAERLRLGVDGATLIFNDENRGFGAAANQGALEATGRHLCFLNSDAFVTAGWLPPMLGVLDGDEGVAAVVPRILNMDGTLQEVGSLIGRNAISYALGYGQDPERLEYRFSRTLDYGSGACLLVRRRDFASAGGFDAAYRRGYYEDVDLGLTLAAAGRRTVYQPQSTVRHVRGASTVFDAATTEVITTNRATFQAAWSHWIESRPSLESLDRHPHRLVSARDHNCSDRILVVGDRSGATASLGEELALLWPTARVTLLHDTAWGALRRTASMLAAGVEIVEGDGDWQAWLELRRYHYSVVVFGGADQHHLLESLVADTQPQAMQMLYHRANATPPAPSALEVAARLAADVVLYESDADQDRFRAVAPESTSFVLPPAAEPPAGGPDVEQCDRSRRDMTILSAMSHVGVAPPLSRLEQRTAQM